MASCRKLVGITIGLLGKVVMRAIEERDDIGILFDIAGPTQICE